MPLLVNLRYPTILPMLLAFSDSLLIVSRAPTNRGKACILVGRDAANWVGACVSGSSNDSRFCSPRSANRDMSYVRGWANHDKSYIAQLVMERLVYSFQPIATCLVYATGPIT